MEIVYDLRNLDYSQTQREKCMNLPNLNSLKYLRIREDMIEVYTLFTQTAKFCQYSYNLLY